MSAPAPRDAGRAGRAAPVLTIARVTIVVSGLMAGPMLGMAGCDSAAGGARTPAPAPEDQQPRLEADEEAIHPVAPPMRTR